MYGETQGVLAELERGGIGTGEACRLLECPPAPTRRRPRRARWLRLCIREGEGGTNLDFRIPLALVGLLIRMVAMMIRLVPQEKLNGWMGKSDYDQAEDNKRATHLEITKRDVLLLLSGLREVAVSGAGVEVEDGSSEVRVCLE